MPSPKQPFSTILDDLREAFLVIREPNYINWIHPSYRDLVIEELAADESLRRRVLTSISLSGLKVAVSDTSGPLGEDKYPLIVSDSDWLLLCEGCVGLVNNETPAVAADALHVLSSACRFKIRLPAAYCPGYFRSACGGDLGAGLVITF